MPRRSAAAVRRSARRGGRRLSEAAVERYRTAVTERSRWLPAYLAAADVTGAALSLRRPSSGREAEPDPVAPTVVRADAVGRTVSFVLAAAYGWRHTVHAVAIDRDGGREVLADALVHSAAGVVRVNATLPAGSLTGAVLVLLDAEGVALDLPTPELTGVTGGDGGG